MSASRNCGSWSTTASCSASLRRSWGHRSPVTGKDVLDRVEKLSLHHVIRQDDITDPEVLRMRGVWTPERREEFKRMVLNGAPLYVLAKHFYKRTENILVRIWKLQEKGELPSQDDLRAIRRRSNSAKGRLRRRGSA